MNISAGQALLIFAGAWAFILLWPQLGMHFAETLGRHARALSGLYVHVRRGFRCYGERFMERDLAGAMREIRASEITPGTVTCGGRR
jgi:hypothetical protein